MGRLYIVFISIAGLYLLTKLLAWVFYNKAFFSETGKLFADKKDKNLR